MRRQVSAINIDGIFAYFGRCPGCFSPDFGRQNDSVLKITLYTHLALDAPSVRTVFPRSGLLMCYFLSRKKIIAAFATARPPLECLECSMYLQCLHEQINDY